MTTHSRCSAVLFTHCLVRPRNRQNLTRIWAEKPTDLNADSDSSPKTDFEPHRGCIAALRGILRGILRGSSGGILRGDPPGGHPGGSSGGGLRGVYHPRLTNKHASWAPSPVHRCLRRCGAAIHWNRFSCGVPESTQNQQPESTHNHPRIKALGP
jgi:hypothetical protein